MARYGNEYANEWEETIIDEKLVKENYKFVIILFKTTELCYFFQIWISDLAMESWVISLKISFFEKINIDRPNSIIKLFIIQLIL